MAKFYSSEFKIDAVKRVEKTGEPVTVVAADLGVNKNTMNGWVRKYREKPETAFPGSGKLRPEDEAIRKLERENRDLREENEILKKAAAYFAKNQQ